jgi:hypothetical protein
MIASQCWVRPEDRVALGCDLSSVLADLPDATRLVTTVRTRLAEQFEIAALSRALPARSVGSNLSMVELGPDGFHRRRRLTPATS